VYCEKPLARTIAETRKVTAAAREAGVATQLGNHGHSDEGIRLTCEWIADGAIGDVRQVHAWTNVGTPHHMTHLPTERVPVPKGMDWDLWLGPAPKRPFHPTYHPHDWRWWWDFGTDAIGDMGCHNLDPAFMALDLRSPETVEAYCDKLNDLTTPQAAVYYYRFGPRAQMPPVDVTWYSGGLMPPRPKELEPRRILPGNGNGIYFIGDKGTIVCPGFAGNPRIVPEAKMREYDLPPKTLPRSNGHHRDWVDACKGGPPASAGFDYGGPLTELLLLGTVALRCQVAIQWDTENMRAANCPEAEEYITPEYQNGWKL
jgi:predicted dehydrogenase